MPSNEFIASPTPMFGTSTPATSGGIETVTSPVPDGGIASNIPATTSGFDWKALIDSLSNYRSTAKIATPFAAVGTTPAPQPGTPLYSVPTAAPAMEEEQQKQTSAGDAAKYAEIIAKIFGL